jgi:DNA-binding MarR family transcriptional regulator
VRSRHPDRPRPLLVDIWTASELLGGLLDRKLEAAGLDPNGWGTLSVIGAFGPLTPSDVAWRTGRPLTTTSDLIRRLVERGEVERLPNPEDGRSQILRLTKEGEKAWRAGWPAVDTTLRDLAANLDRPLDEIHDTIEDLIAALREASRNVNTIP